MKPMIAIKNSTWISPINIMVILWLVAGISYICLMPVRANTDQLHYLGIAWNMFKSHHWLLTYAAAESQKVDLEKTPLLYWFILAGWHLFGVSEIWAKVVIFLLGTANFALTYVLTRQIFPENPRIAWLAFTVLMCNFFTLPFFEGVIRFESLVTVFGLLFLVLLLKHIRDQSLWSLLAAGCAFGFCLFAKGGVGFIYYFPLAILLPFLVNKTWKAGWLISLGVTVAIALIIPALFVAYVYLSLGIQEGNYLLFRQISQRTGLYFHIAAPISVLLCFSIWMMLFRFKKPKLDQRILVLAVPIVSVFLFFALFVGIENKRYFIPVCPFIAIIFANLLNQYNDRDKPVLILAMLIGGGMILSNNILDRYSEIVKYKENLTRLAIAVKSLQLQGYPVAQFSENLGRQFLDFLGRLPNELPEIYDAEKQAQWLQDHPHGYVVDDCEKPAKTTPHCFQIKRDGITISLWKEEPVNYYLTIFGKHLIRGRFQG
jgi:4-amino-4-deoxy-L-arabinose transferase-like glycosyltransferase